MEAFYITLMMVENCCNTCGETELPQKTDYRNQALDHLKDAIFEVSRVKLKKGVIDQEGKNYLLGMMGSLAEKCRNCDSKKKLIAILLKQEIVSVVVNENDQIIESDSPFIPDEKGNQLLN